MTSSTLARSDGIPSWIKRTSRFALEGLPDQEGPAILPHGVVWGDTYAHPVLNPVRATGQIALLFESGFYVGVGSGVRDGIAACSAVRSRWWATASVPAQPGWYDWDGERSAHQPGISEAVASGDEIIVMASPNVPGLVGLQRPVLHVDSFDRPVVPAMDVASQDGDQQTTWVVTEWVRLPGKPEVGPELTAAVVEERVKSVLLRIRSIAKDEEFCDEYEEEMAQLGFLEKDYRKGAPLSRYRADVQLTYDVDGDDIAEILSRQNGGDHTVKGTVRVVSDIGVDFDWDGEDEAERDDLIESAVTDADIDGYYDMEIGEVIAL